MWAISHGLGIRYHPLMIFRDNDRLYGKGVTSFLEACGIEEVRTAYHSPWQIPFVERFFGTLRRELLNHIIPFNDRHLSLREFKPELTWL